MNERLGARPAARMLAIVAAIVGLLPAVPLAQQDRQSARSVVKITCKLPGGVMNATGFVWRDSLHVVTALHAVVGCNPRIVYSQDKRDQSPATIEKVSLEADLALLKLERDLGLDPIKHITSPPNTREQFYTWGYPHGVGEMIDLRTEFAGGLKGGVTTLEDAFGGVKDLNQLFSGQNYPQKSTSILRVTTTIQPGHSGAPILDSQGRVVAIADGGLLDGVKGINWSIPAHLYLTGLPSSPDAVPQQPSKWAGLYSKFTVEQTKTVAVPPDARNSGFTAVGALKRVRTMSLADLDALLRDKGTPESNIDFIKSQVKTAAEFNRLSFDIYEDPLTGATLGVPSGAQLAWNSAIRALEARSGSGAVRMVIGVLPSNSYAEAKVAGKQAFVSKIMNLAKWAESPSAMGYDNLDDRMEWANNAGFFKGTDSVTGKPVELLLSITVSGKQLLGYAVYGPEDIAKELMTQDLITYLMMQMGAQELSGFAVQ